jgi:hypothetical protein
MGTRTILYILCVWTTKLGWGEDLKRLNEAQITAKSVEISKCLINTATGLISYDLGTTQSIGDAARLAVGIRHYRDKIERETLAAVSSALKIDFRVVEAKILPMLEELDWIEVRRSGNRVSTVSEKIPPTVDILTTLGKIWKEQ